MSTRHNHLTVLGKRSPKRYVVVYDLGGGTFDTSAVSLVDRRFDPIATEGIGRLGGEDFDAVILELALAAARIDPASLAPVQRAHLLEICREAKEALSPGSRKLSLDFGACLDGMDLVTLEMAAVNDACMPLVLRTLELLERIFGERRRARPRSPQCARARRCLPGRRRTGFPLVGKLLRERYSARC